jgi:hypothetical protein
MNQEIASTSRNFPYLKFALSYKEPAKENKRLRQAKPCVVQYMLQIGLPGDEIQKVKL